MFDWRTLVGTDLRLVAAAAPTSTEPIPWIIQRLLRKQVHRGGERIRYPVSEEGLAPVTAYLQSASPEELAAVGALLLDPPRVFRLHDGGGTDGERGVGLIGVFQVTGNDPLAATARLTLRSQGKWEGDFVEGADIRCIRASDRPPEEVSAELEELFLATDPSQTGKSIVDRGLVRPHKSVWVGGSMRDVDGLPYGWELRVVAAHAVRGMRVSVTEAPRSHPERTWQGTVGQRPDLVLIWRPYSQGELLSRIEAAFRDQSLEGRLRYIDERPFDDALIMARLELESYVDSWSPPEAWPPPTPGQERYYQKVGSGAGGDRYDHRDGPCQHEKWQALHKADKKFKAIRQMEAVSPRSIHGCSQSGCHRVRATF